MLARCPTPPTPTATPTASCARTAGAPPTTPPPTCSRTSRPGRTCSTWAAGPAPSPLTWPVVAPGHVVGVDAAGEVLAEARGRVPRPAPTTSSFELADLFALPFADDSFDVVHAHQVLQHVADPVAGPGRAAPGVPARRSRGRPRQGLPGLHLRPAEPGARPGDRRLRRGRPGERRPAGTPAATCRAGHAPPGSPRWRRHGVGVVLRHRGASGRGGAACGPSGVAPARRWPTSCSGYGIADRDDLDGVRRRVATVGRVARRVVRRAPRRDPGHRLSRPADRRPGSARRADRRRGSGPGPRPSGSAPHRRGAPPVRRAGLRPGGRPWRARRSGRRSPTRRPGATGGRRSAG